jgi:Deoxyribodipyrimidine photolyase
MFHFPSITTGNYKQEFDQFPWRNDDQLLHAWKWGKTGYPIVDAGMRELYETGFMHNRLRMITASFLTKHLRLDWRHGEAWFWDCLVDADLASNTASWQWVAGSGADAAPYFRIFNPITQGEKFDPKGDYTRQYVPELSKLPNKLLQKPWTHAVPPANYPGPVVDHAMARAEALAAYDRMRGK